MQVCKVCEAPLIESMKINNWELKSKGTIRRIDLFKCGACGKQTRFSTNLGTYEYEAPEKKQPKKKKGRAVSIAKQINLTRYKTMRANMEKSEIAILLCQHYTDPESKATCKACYMSMYRMDQQLTKIEVKDKTLDQFDFFEEIPVIQEFIEDRTLRKVGYKQHIASLGKYWIILDRKHPGAWNEDDIVKLVKHIRDRGISEYSAQQPIRALLKFLDLKGERGRPLLNHPLLEASKTKMASSRTKNGSVEKTYVEPKEFLDLINHVEDLTYKVALWVHVTLGCREGTKDAEYNRGRGGIIGLNWNKVSWENKSMDVYETKTKGGITWVDCPLDLFSEDCYNLLKKYWISVGSPTEGPMFPFSYKVYRMFFMRKVSPFIGRKITPHKMRDTHATWLLNMDVKVETICGTINRSRGEAYALGVGWMNPQIFFEHYARIMRRTRDKEMKKAKEGFKTFAMES